MVVVEQPGLEFALDADERDRPTAIRSQWSPSRTLDVRDASKEARSPRARAAAHPTGSRPVRIPCRRAPRDRPTIFDQPELVGHREDLGFGHDPVALEELADPPADVDFQPVRSAFDEDPDSRHHESLIRSSHGVKPPRRE